MSISRSPAAWVATLVVAFGLTACDTGTSPVETPGSIEVVHPPPVQARAGETVAAGFLIRGGGGRPAAGVRVDFEVVSGGGHTDLATAISGLDGIASVQWTLGLRVGPQELLASPGAGLEAVVTVTAHAGVPARLIPLSVSGRGIRGNVVDSLPQVRVEDSAGVGVAGEPVTFSPASGSGFVGRAVVMSDSLGVASPGAWRLGVAPGAQRMTATVRDLSVDFAVLAEVPPVDRLRIDLRFLGPYAEAESAAVAQAAVRWQTLIRSQLPDLTISSTGPPPPECGVVAGESIDDVVIAVRFFDVGPDPVAQLLGEATICLARAESLFPAVGLITLYTEEINRGGFELRSVALHEIGHVLGLGMGPWAFGNGGVAFVGARARQAYLLAGGLAPTYCPESTGFLCRGFPPITTIGNHWSEAVFGTELMTPLANGPHEPLSAVTLAALRDMGYVADEYGADPFQILVSGTPLAAPSRSRVSDRVVSRPLARITRDGRVIP